MIQCVFLCCPEMHKVSAQILSTTRFEDSKLKQRNKTKTKNTVKPLNLSSKKQKA